MEEKFLVLTLCLQCAQWQNRTETGVVGLPSEVMESRVLVSLEIKAFYAGICILCLYAEILY